MDATETAGILTFGRFASQIFGPKARIIRR